MLPSLTTEHLSVRCSDEVLRRFYVGVSKSTDTDTRGHVIYNGARVEGFLRRVGALLTFKARDTDAPIPKKAGWSLPANCCAPTHCERTRRCCGGCKK